MPLDESELDLILKQTDAKQGQVKIKDAELEKLLNDKSAFLNSIDDSVNMDMLAYEYAVKAGADPKAAAAVFEVSELIDDAKKG